MKIEQNMTKIININVLLAMTMLLWGGCGGGDPEWEGFGGGNLESKADNPEADIGDVFDQPLWQMNFDGLSGAPRAELQQEGFSFQKAMDDGRIALSSDPERLILTATKPAFGMMVNKSIQVEGAEWIEIEWGVDQYPRGADWSKGSNREAVMVYVFLGEPRDADWFFLPESPYFIGMFLGQQESTLTPYKGKYYKKTGRFVSLGSPEQGEVTTSRFNFGQAYRQWFKKTGLPPVTGIAIEVDTDDLPEGRSAAFISRIRLGGTIAKGDIPDQT